MSFASNVQMTSLTGSGQAVSGRTRLNGLYFTCGSTASTIDLYNGTAVAGDPLVSINTPASAGAHNVIIPDGGVLFTDGIYADLGADAASVSLVYVGGGKPAVPPAPPVTTYTSGADYSYAGFNGMGTSGYLVTQSMSGAMTTAFQALTVGDTIVANYGTTPFAILTVTGAPTFQGPGPGDWGVSVSSDTYLMGSSFSSLTF